ncbi:hypothetical protein BC941DRAFT_471284 [Chlamydoabsidia padenii]|nr:hypothetical protein BC941DRAFT_471284 [Chlamydoabsidia padenii]
MDDRYSILNRGLLYTKGNSHSRTLLKRIYSTNQQSNAVKRPTRIPLCTFDYSISIVSSSLKLNTLAWVDINKQLRKVRQEAKFVYFVSIIDCVNLARVIKGVQLVGDMLQKMVIPSLVMVGKQANDMVGIAVVNIKMIPQGDSCLSEETCAATNDTCNRMLSKHSNLVLTGF